MSLTLTVDEMEQLVTDVEKLNINDTKTRLAISTIKSYVDDGYSMDDLKECSEKASSAPTEDKHAFFAAQLIYEEYLIAQAMIEHLQDILNKSKR